MSPRFKRRDGASGSHHRDCSPLVPECRQPGIRKPMSLNAFEDVTDRFEPAAKPKYWGKRRFDEEPIVGDIKLIGMISAIDAIVTPVRTSQRLASASLLQICQEASTSSVLQAVRKSSLTSLHTKLSS